MFSFAGIWRSWRGPLKKDGETTEVDVFAFMTTKPNKLVATIHPTRMPVMLNSEEAFDTWLHGTPEEEMEIVQSGSDRQDLLAA